MPSNRRDFVRTCAGAGAAFTLTQDLTMAADTESLPIIDTHQHLWDLDTFVLPWVGEVSSPAVLKKSYVTKDYLEAVKGLNVVKAIYMEVDVREDLQDKEADHVIALSRSDEHPTVAAVISGRPESEKFAGYMARFRDTEEVKGARRVLHGDTPGGYCLKDQFVKSVRLLGEMQKSFDICIRPKELGDAVKLAQTCPDTLLILDHCGNADPKAWRSATKDDAWHGVDEWKRGIEALAKEKRVICKISGILARAPEDWKTDDLAPSVDFCLDAFGPDRVVFGSDWPVCKVTGPLSAWVKALKEIISTRPLEDQRKLLHDNAMKHYRLA